MIWSGEKHAQDLNLIWCILMALRPNLLLTVYRNTLYLWGVNIRLAFCLNSNVLIVKALIGAFNQERTQV